jgi:hypothetical protein
MATTTPNYGWAVPTSTDLVKDGATAIETLGDSIDASLVDLRGGTTGQVLKKASATQMDFEWGSAGGLTLINTTSFSAVSSQNMANNLFTGTYKNYLLMLNWQQNTTAGSIGLRLRASGSDATTNYFYAITGFTSSNASDSTGAGSQTAFYFATSAAKADGAPNAAYIYVHDPLTAARTMFNGQSSVWQTGDRITGSNFSGMHSTATAYDSFSLTPTFGTMTGSISVYGVSV